MATEMKRATVHVSSDSVRRATYDAEWESGQNGYEFFRFVDGCEFVIKVNEGVLTIQGAGEKSFGFTRYNSMISILVPNDRVESIDMLKPTRRAGVEHTWININTGV